MDLMSDDNFGELFPPDEDDATEDDEKVLR